VEFYLLAPGVMGGSTSKATELAGAAPRPEQVQALQARVAMADRRLEVAAQGLAKLPPSLEHALASDVQAWSVQAGLALINEGQWAKAQALLERCLRNRPDDAGARCTHWVARVAKRVSRRKRSSSTNRLLRAKNASAWPVQYRIGLTLEQLGRPDDAKAGLQAPHRGRQGAEEPARRSAQARGGSGRLIERAFNAQAQRNGLRARAWPAGRCRFW
jgi:tetratricopeptide (TPR) repeat protein